MRQYELLLTRGGQAELIEQSSGETVWSSTDDETFLDEFGAEFLEEDDAAMILDYLVDQRVLTSRQADHVTCTEEFVDTGPGDEDDEDEDDDDIDDVHPFVEDPSEDQHAA